MAVMAPWRRDALSSVEGVPATFSSWNNCMSKAYCKWPAIIGIIIGAVIVFSLIWCLVRCLCCGMSCCCSCFSCCESCCPSGRHKSHRHLDQQPSSFPPASYHGYQPAPPPPTYEPPRFAQFDVGRNGKINDDALPPMPSWETANQRKVPEQLREEELEMGRLDPVAAQRAPMLANIAPPPRIGYAEADSSPVHAPYQHQPGFQGGDLGRPYGQEHSLGAYTGYARPAPSVQGPNGTAFGGPHTYGGSPQPQDFGGYGGGYGQQHAYSTYSPSTSTRYEPSANYQQQTGVTYGSRSPQPQQTNAPPPGLLQVGRKPVQGSWRDA
ncbi:MAG: hypothetical protein M1830_007362 [Pleopsidium flavum]|nr:MAG: hypothetical protein M1830_007362 [Pleopsidium flavum]